MDVIKAIRARREITSFTNKPLEEDVLEKIVEAGYYAPTGNNLPSRELIVVTKRETLDELEKTTPFMPWLKKATGAIVVTGRPTVSKYWIQDASIASAFIWLQATELNVGLGFGAVYHHEDQNESARRENWVREKLHLPDDRRIIAILGIGYAKERPDRKTLPTKEEIVFYEKYKGRLPSVGGSLSPT